MPHVRRSRQLVAAARLRLRRDIELNRLARLSNALGLSIGSGSFVDVGATLKGGESPGFFLAIGERVTIRGNSYVSARKGNVELGDDSYIGHAVWIGGRGRITIGSWLLCGPYSVIVSSNHDFRRKDIPYASQGEIASTVIIEDNVWIGASAVVLPGAVVGSNSVVAAGSVVAGEVPRGVLVGGVPARKIRDLAAEDAGDIVSPENLWNA